ncbi:hypothetical protein AWB78_07735 [Caballeronia calidae]|uniref:Uncharacterized protein n=1 Tax=Caballeronia calidae TaxID=1777139 RepID=A0A158EG91_9BURK|nr:hypothetical protein [Caballeronia calidae]SAL05848.1 hypothetical protein AWB78_07735 [Caballeronia calidae]
MERQYHYRGFRVVVEVMPVNSLGYANDATKIADTEADGYTSVVKLIKPLASGIWNAVFRLNDLCEAPVMHESAAFWSSYIVATKIIDDALTAFGGSVEALPTHLTPGGTDVSFTDLGRAWARL